MKNGKFHMWGVCLLTTVLWLVATTGIVFANGRDEVSSTSGERSVSLSPGWDIFNDRFSSGEVVWKTVSGQEAGNFEAVFNIRGARPNYEYTAGLHLFNPVNPAARPDSPRFDGREVGGEGVVSREGKASYVIAWDFGGLRTDVNGNATARFVLTIPQGTYNAQFTVRTGGWGSCHTARGITHGCSVVARTGGRFGQSFEIIDFAKSAPLTKGWDIFGDPLASGLVDWDIIGRGGQANNLRIVYQLQGAKPNHAYTVGVHFFNPDNLTARPAVSAFDGWNVGGEGVINRDGKTAYVIAWDLGGLQTDGRGNGNAAFSLSVPSGIYHLQYTVRIGGVGTCYTSQGITHGCAVSYRSGGRFGEQIHTLRIP